MKKKKILFKVTGSIAAYKACYLISKLVQNNFDVQVVTSESAKHFIGDSTLEGLTGHPVLSDLFAANHAMDHIHLIREADLVLVCPATANFTNKIAHGVGDDLLSTLFLAHDFKKPYLIAPAMNTSMYMNPTTQNSLERLKVMGVSVLETQSGVLACGENGWGKLLDPELIYTEIINSLKINSPQKKGKQLLITSGGTQEPIDAVRFITNLSTGKTGAFLADQFITAGYDVTYLHGKNAFLPTQNCKNIEFGGFQSLENKMRQELFSNHFNSVIHLAAVSDYSLKSIEKEVKASDKSAIKNGNYKTDNNSFEKIESRENLKIPSGEDIILHLKANPKILNSIKDFSLSQPAQIGAPKDRKSPLVIGFKLTVNLNAHDQRLAVNKIFAAKNVDYVVHNDLSEIDDKNQKHQFHIFQNDSPNLIDCHNKFELFKNLLKIIEKENKEHA